MRIGDAERDAAAADLGEHFTAGRLTLEELHERLEAVFAAFLLFGIVGIFGIGSGRPFAVVLLFAAFAMLRRLLFLIFGRRRGAGRGPRRRRR